MNKSELGNKIRERRSELGITQEDLAELSETSSKTVREIEKGKGNPRFDTVMAILAVLGLVLLLSSLSNNSDG
jgi:y4mF family transcriptional regulator